MKYLLSIALVILLNRTQNTVALTIDDHYWRDFNRVLPSDGLVSGVNKNGKSVYVAQMHLIHDEHWDFVPTGISVDAPIANASYWFSVRSISDQARIKVMCSSNPNHYHWYSNKDAVPPGCRNVVAGRESDRDLYAGRAKEDHSVIGKYFSDDSFTTMIAAVNGSEIFYDNYEILTYCG